MKTLMRRVLASSLLGAGALALVGCGGGGNGSTVPTATPIGTPNATTTGTPNATVTPTTTTPPNTGGSPVSANEFAFVSTRAGAPELYKSSLNGSNVVRLTALGSGLDNPSVSTDGSRLLFQTGQSNAAGGTTNLEIAVINTNGSGYQPLTTDGTPAGRPDDSNPVFSPGDQYIYWTSTRGGLDEAGQAVDRVPHIWRMDGLRGNAGERQGQIIREPSAFPSFDRNGNFAYYAPNQANPIAIANIAGTVTKRIGSSVGTGQSVTGVALSPDGTRVAYSVITGVGTGVPTSAEIRIFNVADGRAETSVSGVAARVGAWSRNSSTLYFDAFASGIRQVFSTSSPFSTSTQVSQGSTNNYSPALLPGN